MKFWNNFKRNCALEYIESIMPVDKSKQERSKWLVEVHGHRVDDLIDPPERIPFEESYHFHLKKEAMDLGRLEWDAGNEVEVWKLIKRWI